MANETEEDAGLYKTTVGVVMTVKKYALKRSGAD
jgi:hypothetical protein